MNNTFIIAPQSIQINKTTVLNFCRSIKLDVPVFCYNNLLGIRGNCRMCLIQIYGFNKPLLACSIILIPGIKLILNRVKVFKIREGILTFILKNHPLDCPICDQGIKCDLQDHSQLYGKP